MKFTLSWLKMHLDTDASPKEITDTLTRIGLEVEDVEDRGATLAPFRIARVIEAVQHPNADRLRVCNLIPVMASPRWSAGHHACTGMKGVFAAPGSLIPGTGTTLRSARSAECAAPACCCQNGNSESATSMPASSTCPKMHRSGRTQRGQALMIR